MLGDFFKLLKQITPLGMMQATLKPIFGIDDVLLGGTILKGALDFFGNKGDQDAEKEARQLYNDWLSGREKNVDTILAKLQERGFDPFGAQTTTQQGTTSGTSSTSFNQRTSPFITKQYKELEGLFRGAITDRLRGGSALPEGYVGAAARAANEGAQAARVAAGNLAASRGLSGEQALSIAEPIEISRVGRIQDVATQLPLLERQLRNEDINLAAGLTGQFGKGTSSSGTSTTNSMSTSSGSTTRPPDINSLLAFLQPPSPQAGMNVGANPALAAGSGLVDSLLSLYAGRPGGGGGGGLFDIFGNPTTDPSQGISG